MENNLAQFLDNIRKTLEETRQQITVITEREIEKRLAEIDPYRRACQRIMNPENYKR
jgi:nucleoside-triphosphatase THEP1